MKTPTYAVIKVDSAGEARITKQWARECASVARVRCSTWKGERRNARIAGMRYFRLSCLGTIEEIWWINPLHEKLEGKVFHVSEIFSCRCCFPEWLFSKVEVDVARDETQERLARVGRGRMY